MGKGNNSTAAATSTKPARKGTKPAAPAPVVLATVVPAGNGAVRGVWQGYTISALLRALGYAGYTVKQATALLPAVGLVGVSGSTVGCQVGAGRQYARGVATPHHTGGVTPLTPALLAQVVTLVGPAGNPHATTAAPVLPKAAGMPLLVAVPAAAPAPVPTAKPARKRK